MGDGRDLDRARPPRATATRRRSPAPRARDSAAPPENEAHATSPSSFGSEQPTVPLSGGEAPGERTSVRRFRLTVVEGPGKGHSWDSTTDACSIGSDRSNDLIIEHPNVSRFHCEVKIDHRGATLRDLNSRNGTLLDGVQVREAVLRSGSLIQLARRVTVRFDLATRTNRLPVSERSRFGALVGSSLAMRHSFGLMERAATCGATVLLEGETGSGKTEAARAIHEESARGKNPFVVVDCGVIPENLIESELFGHERGSFTGAVTLRIGAFEAASGGTIFLDEIGELPISLQPKLLRAIDQREISRIGTSVSARVDVRVIAATNRDLRAEVNAGRFRPDLFYRLAVIRIPVPALRQRPEDIPLILERILSSLSPRNELAEILRAPESIEKLKRAAWPGNIRELRNHVERCLVFQDAHWPVDVSSDGDPPAIDAALSYPEARRKALEDFERDYLLALLALHGGNVTRAAGAAGLARGYLHRLLRKHRIEGG